MQRLRPFSIGQLALAVGFFLMVPQMQAQDGRGYQSPPAGHYAKTWLWTNNANGRYNEPPRQPTPPTPAQRPQKYQVLIYVQMEKTSGDEANMALLLAHLPEDADIWFQEQYMGRKDQLMREFISPPLIPGRNYSYDVKVNWAEEGHRVEQSLTVPVQAGDILCLDLRSVRDKDVQAEIKAALDKLGPEDRKLAEQQGFCPVQGTNPLGSMGKPIKVVLKDQPVFLCCPGCKEKAEKDPDKTLARFKELMTKKTGPPTP
jgi:uncharacterized protein (TIGR03000 family)